MTTTWTGLGASNSFNVAENWNSGTVPTSGDISVDDGFTVSITQDEGHLDNLNVAGKVTFTGSTGGNLFLNVDINLGTNSDLILGGGISITTGVVTSSPGATGGKLELDNATLDLYGAATTNAPTYFDALPSGQTNKLIIQSYSTLSEVDNLGSRDIIGSGTASDTYSLVLNSGGTIYTLENTHNGVYTSVISSDVTLASGVNPADFTSQSGYLIYSPPCFCAGTRLATPSGGIAVEDIVPGTVLLTASGEAKPVRWLGRSTVATRFADAARVLPVRIRAGALGEDLPGRDLLVSPCHALLIDGVLANAVALVNGTSIVRERAAPEVFIYYHVELTDHEVLLAEGVPAESFIDDDERPNFDNWAEREVLPARGVPMAELPYPRAKSQRQVPASIRRLLAAHAVPGEARLVA